MARFRGDHENPTRMTMVVSLRLSSREAREFAEALVREADAADLADPDFRQAVDR